jgi:hypothetical protein
MSTASDIPAENAVHGRSAATSVTERVEADRRGGVMAPAAEAPRGAAPASRVVPGVRPAVPPGGLVVVGLMTILAGAWGGIVPFVGPIFGYSGDGTTSWYWSFPHAMLWLVPGAVAVFCGLSMLGHVWRAARGFARIGSATTGLVVAACGAWFVFGPLSWPVLEHSAGVFVPASPLRELAYWAGYSLGPGVLLATLGGIAFGWAVRSSRVVGSRRTTEPAPVAAA